LNEHRVATERDSPRVVVLPPFLYGGAFLVMLALRWFWRMPIAAPVATLWPGIVLSVLAVGIAIAGRRTMEAAGTNVNPMLPTTAIVTSGPFRFSRNPLYVALTLLFLGLTLAFDTWWGIILLPPVLLVMHYGVVLREERYLERKFGEPYRQYRSRVRRYL
jgi:protein-S-isoprenylcysteine O-methyltransferase Ste14